MMRALFLVVLLVVLSLSFTDTLLAAPGGVSADLEVWLKADAGINETDGDGVNSWNDQSSQTNNATQTDSTKQPTYENDAENNINHNPVLRFDDDDYLSLGNLSAIKGGSNYTIYTVGVREDDQSNYIISADDGHNNDQDLFFGYLDTDTVRLGQWANNLDVSVDDFDSNETTPYMLFGEFDGSGHKAFELYEADKTEDSNTNSTGLSGSKDTYIGWHNGVRYYDGRIAEVIIYNLSLIHISEPTRPY